MEKLLNLKEVSESLKVSVHTVRLWTYQKKIPVVKLGRRCLYRENDLEKFVEKNVKYSV
jgi:excisionase family DNA binding protein